MTSFKKVTNIVGILVFGITFLVYFNSAERTGSLWDCGEFILGAYKLQVVHPPGAGLFVLIGRMFAWVASIFSDNPSDIAFAVNLMSSIASSFAAVFIGWTAMLFGRFALMGRFSQPTISQNVALGFTGLVAGLATAFSTSVWFSAVEGEVYAMSTFFTALTIWSAVVWYCKEDNPENDRWLIFSLFSAGLSIGVHLLSLLAFPAIAMLYYFKKHEDENEINFKGLLLSVLGGFALIAFIQKVIIAGIPNLWKNMELLCVNSFGLPIHSGLVPTILIIGALVYYMMRLAYKKNSQLLQNLTISTVLIILAYSTVGVVVLRSIADTPVNMNTPNDAMRLLPYLNREQYGERPLLYGPTYAAEPKSMDRTPRYGRVGDHYEMNDEKIEYTWSDKDKILFPRIGHQDKIEQHEIWRSNLGYKEGTKPGMAYNLEYMLKYQINWMYWRYFMWNFVGRQNAEQGQAPWFKQNGNWLSGIDFIDQARLHNFAKLPDTIKNDPSRNKYYFLPLIFGILGLVFHYRRSKKEFLAVLMLFLMTGLGIIIYSNQPPIEPRERDYVLVGSFITFCIWIGMGVLAIYEYGKRYMENVPMAALAGVLALSAPVIMGYQNFDDHSRKSHYASRDYAANFLNSLEKNAIIFTYGDNDTYPLWYCQEVENIRRDVRVVNLSLIQVDWYINKLRSKVNDSPPIKFTIPQEAYDGKPLNQVFFDNVNKDQAANLFHVFKFLTDSAKKNEGYAQLPIKNFIVPIDRAKIEQSKVFHLDTLQVVDSMVVSFPPNASYMTKDDIAILDLVFSNIYDRPVYFSVTCQNSKLQGLNDYMQMEGLGLRVIPVKTASDRSLSIFGSGRINADMTYNNIMNNWKWGNFDKVQTFVDRSYFAQVQAMQVTMLRTGIEFLKLKDNEKAAKIANKYFESFPHMNFAYDASVIPFINILVEAKDLENAKKNLRIMLNESSQYADFIFSLKRTEIISFGEEIEKRSREIKEGLDIAKRIGDPTFEKEMNDMVGSKLKQLEELTKQ